MIDPACYVTWQGLRDAIERELTIFSSHLVARKTVLWGDELRSAAVVNGLAAGSKWFVDDPSAWRRLAAMKGGPAVIVAQHHDATMPSDFVPPDIVGTWFGTHITNTHPNVVAMPIGLDRRMVPSLQRAERKKERDIPLYLNFSKRSPERAALYEQFKGFPGAVLDRWDRENGDYYASQLGRARFVVSPPGIAWDCYRTYDAIAMGAIPIVKASAASHVVNDLPVMVVDQWSDVTPESLMWWGRLIDGRRNDQESLLQTYWVRQIAAAAHRWLQPETAAHG